ncbi:Uncharacterised protein [Mycobacteroides abscessus subsp. abscessus]|nr:Uncharacterised protein [Mycobacteroides abscessus subsp. abscessus]
MKSPAARASSISARVMAPAEWSSKPAGAEIMHPVVGSATASGVDTAHALTPRRLSTPRAAPAARVARFVLIAPGYRAGLSAARLTASSRGP